MMQIKRRDRLIDLTSYLLGHPNQSVTLKSFMNRYHCAKSSLSKDVTIIKHNFAARGIGKVKTQVGAIGGVTYFPIVNRQRAQNIIETLIRKLNRSNRKLPGGYVYMSDLLSQPYLLEQIGKVIATYYIHDSVDIVMTMSGKGIIAASVARALGTPFISARHHSRISDGATINVSYFSAYSHQFHNLVLPQRSLSSGANVLIVDDYLKGGSTIKGMINLIKAFRCHLSGVAILADGNNGHPNFDIDYLSLIRFKPFGQQIRAEVGNLFNNSLAK